jgi:hypothetical protein
MPMMPGMMGSSGGMMHMMEMMNHCTTEMEDMHSGAHGEMGMGHGGQMTPGMMGGQMMPGMMGDQGMEDAQTVRFDQMVAEGLARAYLAGRSPEAVEIREITFDSGLYTVAYSQGDDEGTLTVDAATGEVQAASR